MVRRSYKNMPNDEPDQKTFEKPSQGEHLFQVVDVITIDTDKTGKLNIPDENTVVVKCEVVGGKEEGRSLLQRLNLDIDWKGFFATRLFLKAIGEPYKGSKVDIDTDEWIGKQFYATVVHSGQYANIDVYPEGKNPINKKEQVDFGSEEESPL